MFVHSVNIRLKGQMTPSIDARKDLDIRDGGKILLEQRGNDWVLVRPEDLIDQLAGALAEYATDVPLEWNREEL